MQSQRELEQESSYQTRSPHIRQNRPSSNTSRDKEGHYITIKGLIQEEDVTIVNIYEETLMLGKIEGRKRRG